MKTLKKTAAVFGILVAGAVTGAVLEMAFSPYPSGGGGLILGALVALAPAIFHMSEVS